MSDACSLLARCADLCGDGLIFQKNPHSVLVGILAKFNQIPTSQLLQVINTVASFQHLCIDEISRNLLMDLLLNMLLCEDEQVVGSVLLMLVPAIIDHHTNVTHKTPNNNPQLSSPTIRLWSSLMVKVEHLPETESNTARVLLIFCGIVDQMLKNITFSQFDEHIISCNLLWLYVQQGFCHNDSLTRKRSTYFLKRILDCALLKSGDACRKETAAFDEKSKLLSSKCLKCCSPIWQEFILLMEMLEEKQVTLAFVSKLTMPQAFIRTQRFFRT